MPEIALESTPSSPSPAVPECKTCGACCYGDDMWIHVMAADDQLLGEPLVRRLTVLTQHGRGYVARSMKMVNGRCVAYQENDAGVHAGCCSIYASRPAICREFAAGTPDCHAARRRRGFE
jgi:Fe-S-cluster containining protein